MVERRSLLLEIFLSLDEELLGGFDRFGDTRYHQQLVAAPVTGLLLGGVDGTTGLTEHDSVLVVGGEAASNHHVIQGAAVFRLSRASRAGCTGAGVIRGFPAST